jgi:hypothetical protein
MRRINFIELHEQSWLPSSIRNNITDMLQFGLIFSNAYGAAVPSLQRALQSTGSHFVVDLCSGGGGPWLDLSRKLQANGWSIRVCLTDKYPNAKAFENAETISENITFYPEAVDATNVPLRLKGFRTMFSSFHHFPQKQALAILQNAIDVNEGVGIFEVTRRTPSAVAFMLPWALTAFALTPFIRPFRWSRLLWTYVIPVIPFVLLFDGIVSCLRTYRPQELNQLVEELEADEYHWETGTHWNTFCKLPITYLIGYPRGQSPNTGHGQKEGKP